MKNPLLWLLLLISLTLTVVTKNTLVSNSLYFNSLAEKLSYEQIQELLAKGKKWEWVGYILVLIVYIIKCLLVALCLTLGVFFVFNRFEFKRMFNIAVMAEFVFLIPTVFKLLWFLFIQTSYTLQDLQYFHPFSVLSIFDPLSLEPWLIYPLQVLNVFEAMYWVVLAYLLSKELPELDMNRSMTVVMSGYGTGLIIWVAFVMFLTLTYT
ncbi:hypothetical protein [Dyadobacter psychrotolerans]|uniref:Yip1 domain-containing protein n=1 Tax=Dyadobacter psychrotolerans TaxID=2541721 RepID=A0A4R5E2Y7_9BACT|nr:hypothetical protein [Dyadobacter psychrotolerans]TDE18653.1 hypothetical protein E0F88_03710 [Dyadobacter psychrotolerans]